MKNINNRTTQYNIEDIFLKRYSPRAMSGEPISKEELMTLFEAARFAPSASNNQPWRFLYAIGGTSDFDLFFSFLNEPNQVWCKNGGALIILLSKKTIGEGKLIPTRSFDAGAAWENLALQGATMDLVIHGMAGYKKDILIKELNIPDDYDVELMIVVGKHGNIKDLPERIQEREAPSQRNDLSEMVFEGRDGVKLL